MQVVNNSTGSVSTGDGINKNDSKNDPLKNILLSPVTNMKTWLHRHDKRVPGLEEVSPRFPHGHDRACDDMTPLEGGDDDSFDDDFFTSTPKAGEFSPEHRFDPIREITNYFPVFSPTPRKEKPATSASTNIPGTITEPPAAAESSSMPTIAKTQREVAPNQNQFDPIQNIVKFFSPPPKKEEPPQNRVPTGAEAGQAHASKQQQTQKRLDFDVVSERSIAGANLAPAPREVATIEELYRDARKALEHMMTSAKEVNFQESWGKAREVDRKELMEKARITAHGTAKKLEGEVTKILDSAKEIEPKEVMEHAKASAKEVAEAVRNNAKAHPRPWAAIGVISLAILVQFLFFSGSVGTPSMRWWRFSVNVHSSRGTGNIVERVGNFIQSQMGEDAEQIMLGAKSTPTTASGQEILSRLSVSLLQPVDNSPDFVDVVRQRIDMVRENPRQHYNAALSNSKGFVVDVWKQGNQLTTQAFDDITAL